MHPALVPFVSLLVRTGNLEQDVDAGFLAYGKERTREHVPRVARLARKLALRYSITPDKAEMAALLHDIGGIVPRGDMVALCHELKLNTWPEETQVPMLLHARISEVLARQFYGVAAPDVLQAIRYHTALHAQPTPLDQVVFLADKIEWDQGGIPPYQAELLAVLEGGLEAGTRFMLSWMYKHQAELLVVLPELRAAWAAFAVGEKHLP